MNCNDYIFQLLFWFKKKERKKYYKHYCYLNTKTLTNKNIACPCPYHRTQATTKCILCIKICGLYYLLGDAGIFSAPI